MQYTMIRTDYHAHTTMSHGKCTVEEYVKLAYERGLTTMTISEHAPANMFYGVNAHGFAEIRSRIDKLNNEYAGKLKVLFGIECNMVGNGKTDICDMDFDVVIVGYHRGVFPKNTFTRSALAESFSARQSTEKNTDEYIRIAESMHVDIFAHPKEYINVNLTRLAHEAAKQNIALEINSRHVTMSVDDLKLCADCGAHFVISSDAHAKHEVACFDAAIAAARKAEVLPLVSNWTEE